MTRSTRSTRSTRRADASAIDDGSHERDVRDEPRPSRRSLLGATLALFVVACRGAEKKPSEDTSKAGFVAKRVVSLGPATTEALFALGAGPITVGRSRFCDKPVEALALPQVGGFTDPNLESILALRPDLVTGVRGPAGNAIVLALEAHKIRTYFPETESKAQIVSLLRGLGDLTATRAKADELVATLEADLGRIRSAIAGKPRRRALLMYGRTPLVVAGTGSFPDEMLTLAGLENACRSKDHYPTIEVEHVLALDPDCLLDASVGMGMDADDPAYFAGPGWSRVRAVREKRVYRVSNMDVMRPGPSFAQGVATLARLVHGPDGLRDAHGPVDTDR